MPQRLRKLDGLMLGPSALATKPSLATYIGIIAAQWTQIDLHLANLLNKIISGDAQQAVSMYLALQSDNARRAIILAAAKHHMSSEDFSNLDNILNKARKRASDRNTIVHGVWGTSTHHPDKLVWCDYEDVLPATGGMLLATINATSDQISKRDDLLRWYIENDSPKYWTYTQQDFEEIKTRLTRFLREIRQFDRAVKSGRAIAPAKPPKPLPPCL